MKKVIIVSLIAFLLFPLYAQESKPLREVTLNTSWFPQAQYAGYFVAAAKGFYSDKGIKVNFIYGGYGPSVKENLTDKKADFGIMWLHEGLLAHNENKDLVNIAQFFHDSNILLVSREKEIHSIGIWKPFVPFLQAFIHSQLSDSIEIVPVRDVVVAFVNGAVDAITTMSYNEYNRLINSGVNESDVYVRRVADMGLVLPEDGLYCRKEFYEKNTKLCKDFVEASEQGWNYAFDHVNEGAKICLNFVDKTHHYSNIILQTMMLNTIKKACNNKLDGLKDLELNRQAFDKVDDFLYKKHLIKAKIQYKQFREGN